MFEKLGSFLVILYFLFFFIDFALETAGGSICSTPFTIPFPSKATYQVFGIITLHYPSNPRLVIQPGNRPGECFAFHGSQGRIRIRLSRRVNITDVSLEHSRVSYDNSSMPRTFNVYVSIQISHWRK